MKNYYTLHNRGAAIITAVMFFVFISITLALGLSTPIVREYINARDFEKSKGAYYLSEAGHEDALYRIKKSKQIGASETLTLNGTRLLLQSRLLIPVINQSARLAILLKIHVV